MDFADDFPECQVTGIDLSPGQPIMCVRLALPKCSISQHQTDLGRVPPNLKFLIDDAEDLWIYNEPFDFIHTRLMAGCFADWPNFFRQAYQYATPRLHSMSHFPR